MNALVSVAGVALATLVAGFAGPRLGGRARPVAWTVAVIGVAAAVRLTATEAPVVRMLAVIGVLLYAMKAVVIADSPPTLRQWLSFAVFWPGMDPRPFLRPPETPGPSRPLVVRGTVALVSGAALLAAARALYPARPALALWLALPALSVLLHFGAFSLLTAFAKSRGLAVDVSFEMPWRATSLSAFWGRSWNPAFTEMTAAAVYRPLARRVGTTLALGAAFAFSGLLHELAISVPVRAGFGLPLAYFALHGALVALERTEGAAAVLRGPVLSRIWTLAWLVLPLPMLFHAPFREGIVAPLLNR